MRKKRYTWRLPSNSGPETIKLCFPAKSAGYQQYVQTKLLFCLIRRTTRDVIRKELCVTTFSFLHSPPEPIPGQPRPFRYFAIVHVFAMVAAQLANFSLGLLFPEASAASRTHPETGCIYGANQAEPLQTTRQCGSTTTLMNWDTFWARIFKRGKTSKATLWN